MSLRVKKLHPLFGGEASGIDIAKPLTHAETAEIVAAMDLYGILLFRGQPLTGGQQVAFAESFGPLDLGLGKINRTPVANRLGHEALIDISNLDASGNIADRNSRKIFSQLANQLWHSDSSFTQPAARYTTLHSAVNPPEGGETEFADLRAAYDALADDLKAKIADLTSEHYALHSRIDLLGDSGYTEEEKNALPPVTWPLVRTHPGSGRKLLWVGIHATRIPGMQIGEGRLLLAELLEHATQREFVYRHRWQVGDTVMWDNRATIHRGMRYDLNQRRELRRVSTEDADRPVRKAA